MRTHPANELGSTLRNALHDVGSHISHPMKMLTLVTQLKRSAEISAFVLGLAWMVVAAGCVSIVEGAAEAPYEKAMKAGRMLPSEFKKEQENIRRASEPVR